MSASVCSSSAGDDCRRKILTSRTWNSMRTSQLSLSRRSLISKSESRRSLMSQAERWESVSSDLSVAKPMRRDSLEDKVDKLTITPSRRPTLQRTCSTALLSTPATTRARKILDSRGWRSFLERKNSLPRKALSSSEEQGYSSATNHGSNGNQHASFVGQDSVSSTVFERKARTVCFDR